jgi:hypothetical protein
MSSWGLRSGVKHRGPRLARRYPSGESERILDGPTLMVRPDLRRDMADIHEISGPHEREIEVEYPEGAASPWGSTVHSGEPGSQGWERAGT